MVTGRTTDRRLAIVVRALLAMVISLSPPIARAQGTATVTPACPASIDVQETLGSSSAPAGWTATLDASPRYLDGVTFFDGPPDKNQSIAPTVDATPVKGRNARVATWRFGTSGEPVWFACRYGGSRVVLSQVLPVATKSCAVTYGAVAVVVAVDCR